MDEVTAAEVKSANRFVTAPPTSNWSNQGAGNGTAALAPRLLSAFVRVTLGLNLWCVLWRISSHIPPWADSQLPCCCTLVVRTLLTQRPCKSLTGCWMRRRPDFTDFATSGITQGRAEPEAVSGGPSRSGIYMTVCIKRQYCQTVRMKSLRIAQLPSEDVMRRCFSRTVFQMKPSDS